MSDLIDEISEDLKEERYSYIVQKITKIFITSAVFVIIAVGLYIWKENNTRKMQVELGQAFHNALLATDENNFDKAVVLYDEVIKESGLQYSALAYLNKAGVLVKQNKVDEAQNTLKQMIEHKHLDKTLRELAENIYLANKLNFNLSFDESDQRILDNLIKEDKVWRLTSLQIKALFEIKNNRISQAQESLNNILKTKNASNASYDTATSILTTISKTN